MALTDDTEAESWGQRHFCRWAAVSCVFSFHPPYSVFQSNHVDASSNLVLLFPASADYFPQLTYLPRMTSLILPPRLLFGGKYILAPLVPRSLTSLTIDSAAEVNSIIICTCFPLMPRFAKLMWDRYSHIKAYTSRHTLERDPVRRAHPQNLGKTVPHNALSINTASFEHPYLQVDEVETKGGEQANRRYEDATVDIELGALDLPKLDPEK